MEHEIEKLYVTHPDKLKEVLLILSDKHPEQVKKAIHRASLGHHLDDDMMHEALSTITRYDGVKAPFWTHAEFKETLLKNNISLIYEKYNEYDLDFLAQYYYADFKSLGQDPITFIHLAEDKFHDIDDDKACEAAYWEAYHRINKET